MATQGYGRIGGIERLLQETADRFGFGSLAMGRPDLNEGRDHPTDQTQEDERGRDNPDPVAANELGSAIRDGVFAGDDR